MQKKSKRLTRRLFLNLRGPGRYFHTEHFSLRTAPSGDGARVGISVSKKISKKAVVRNRTRRRAYAAIAQVLPTLPKKLFLISAKPGAEDLKSTVLVDELAELLKKG
jgi:ribonuclease P protein component